MKTTDNSYSAVLTVVGEDKPGIIAEVTSVLADHKVNVINISQNILKDIFQMIMLIDTTGASISFKDLSKELDKKADQINCQIRLQQREVFTSMHRI
ncbi:MAG: ACT domain-containing protein [Tissierellia bacterium]|nr:ACT domain-containing protein [Tissierellia bacterium]